MRGDFALFGELSKVEEQEDGTLKVFGVASSGARDDAGEIITPAAMKAALPAYLAYPAIREQHRSDIAAGTALELSVGDDGFTRIVAHVVDPGTVKKIKTKTLRGFSVGGRVLKRDDKDPTIITAIKLSEISAVDRPCNPEASIDLWKASDVGQGDEHAMADYAPTNDEVKARAAEMAKAAGKTAMDAFKGYVAKAREDLIAEHEEPVADVTVEPDLDPAIAEAVDKAASGLKPEERGEVLAKVAAAVAAGEDADEAVTKAIAEFEASRVVADPDPAEDPAAILAAAVEKAKGKTAPKPYGNVDYADAKNGKYPIDTAAHIRAAWSYINMPKNQTGYSDAEVKAIKAKIVAAWKSKIDPAGPPSAEKSAVLGDLAKALPVLRAMEGVALEKGFYTVGRQAALLAAAADIAMSVVWEERDENDTASTQPQAMLDIVAALHQLVIDGANEETAEFMHAAEMAGSDGVTLLAPCIEIDMEWASQVADLHKADTDLMEKVGARNSKTDAGHIQAAHDHMVQCGATCQAPDEEAGKAAKPGPSDDLAKEAAGLLTKQADEIDTLKAFAAGETERTAAAIDAALEKFRNEPMPPKTAASTHARVTKQADVNPGADEPDDAQKAELVTWWAGLTPEQRALEAMKSTFRAPVQAR